MNAQIPDWLGNWIKFQPTACDMHVREVESCQDRKMVEIEARWNRSAIEVSQIQVDMDLADPRITCLWKPHLAPEAGMVIGDFVFRSPAIILEKGQDMLALVPDLDFLESRRIAPHIMDYIEPERSLFYGLSHYEKTRHVYHKKVQKPILLEKGQVLFRFHLIQWQGVEGKRDFRPVTSFLWERFGYKNRPERIVDNQVAESVKDLEVYAKHTYDWAFHHWENLVWQQFELDGQTVGGCVLIVRGVQSPGFGQEDQWREKKSLWNQSWFSSLRSAYGYRQWGERWNVPDMVQRAELAKNFALRAPQKGGLFPSVYWADSESDLENGTWGHSNRRPDHHEEYYHLLDSSWTCLWMLKWYRDLEQDDRLLDYTKPYAERLIELQHENGSFPGWVHEETDMPSSYLNDSAETSMHVWFLASYYSLTKDEKMLEAAKQGMEFVSQHVIPEGRFEDFELYWSCSRQWEGKKYGEKDQRSGLYHQCNFSIYWTAEALKELYIVTKDEKYLCEGERVLAELSLYQAIWDPPYLGMPAFGGFGVMTSDDEWNDARQSLFALTFLDYYRLTGNAEYKQRGIWAMKASFYLMYCPENPLIKEKYEQIFPHFSEVDYGFEMENCHHGENDTDQIGEFTIFDWGNGSASASLAEILLKG
ncbi:hypothetical protein [Bacillus sp. Marseille-Q3570]|uniref:hypothetical protein n=1 Tax=Bacillus sp. Marseille-Q3570 TaxID=2963522 RepID=UPI0021B7209E|nr:hypothetical protein [Bacillus sp. Marseille-Q3570]